MTPTRLLFVYNADGGWLNMLKDAWAKTVAPDTYECALCATTWGPVSMRRDWRAWIKARPEEAVFLHRDEWHAAYPGRSEPLPAIFTQDGDAPPRLLVGAGEMRLGQPLDELIALIEARLGDQAGQAE